MSAGADHAEFGLFCELPLEIREHIWRSTVEPRVVPVSCWFSSMSAIDAGFPANFMKPKGRKDVQRVRRRVAEEAPDSTLPLELYAASPLKPAILDVCKESRRVGLGCYEKMILTPDTDISFTWVNYNIDTIHLVEDEDLYEWYDACGSKIRRLKLRVDMGDEWFCRLRCFSLRTFPKLVECFVVSIRSISTFHDSDPILCFRCPPENIHLIEEYSGVEMKYAQLKAMTDTEYETWAREKE